MTKIIPRKKKSKKLKWLSEEALQIAEKKKKKEEAKSKERKGKIYSTELRVPENSKRAKKGSFNEQCKEIEENNSMGKTRDLFKNLGDSKGNFMQG